MAMARFSLKSPGTAIFVIKELNSSPAHPSPYCIIILSSFPFKKADKSLHRHSGNLGSQVELCWPDEDDHYSCTF